ncbi:unnamed protein product [Amaranthus hypochondriacus]
MDNYTTSSNTSPYKGSHQYHHQEWMMMNNNSSSVAGAKVVVVEEGGEEGGEHEAKSVIEKEHMFDKVVTPSDVGKLNRLVIPKQHAEKYFPLDSTINEKGLLLNFEDRTGKPWRFRYSYWNSSQSYVMTKGWSRFVKEKKLDAGDIVSFQRGIGDIGKDKLFIDWRRRPDHNNNNIGINSNFHYNPIIGRTTTSSFHYNPNFVLRSHPHHINNSFNPYGYGQHQTAPHLSTMSLMNVLPSQSIGSGLGLGTGFGYGSVVNPYPGGSNAVFFVRSPTLATQYQNVANSIGEGGEGGIRRREGCGDEESMVIESVPVVQGKAAAKRLRLFGVNMDCPISNQSHDIDILSSSSSSPNHHRYHDRDHDNHDHDHQQHGSNSMGPPHLTLHPPSQSSSRSSSSFFNGRNQNNSPDKGKSSSMSLDLDI